MIEGQTGARHPVPEIVEKIWWHVARSGEGDVAPDGAVARRSLSMASGLTFVVLSLAALIAGIVVFAIMKPAHTDLVALQWAGSATGARAVIEGRIEDFRRGLYWDFFLIASYTVGLVLACLLGRRIFCTTAPSRWSRFGLVATALAAALNLAQDILLLALRSTEGTWVFRVAATASFLKFAALVVAVPIALGALWTAVTRLVTHSSTSRRWETADAAQPRGRSGRPSFRPAAPRRVEAAPAGMETVSSSTARSTAGGGWNRGRWRIRSLRSGSLAASNRSWAGDRDLRVGRRHSIGDGDARGAAGTALRGRWTRSMISCRCPVAGT